MCFNKECLEQRANELVNYPSDCNMFRVVIYAWDSSDVVANDFCQRLKTKLLSEKRINQTYHISAKNLYSNKDEKDGITNIKELNDKLEECEKERKSLKLNASLGYYILFINPPKDFKLSNRFNNNSLFNIECISLTNDESCKSENHKCFYRTFNVYNDSFNDIMSADILINNAVYSQSLISVTECTQNNRYFFRCKEYNSVLINMCNYYLRVINKQFENSEYFDKEQALLQAINFELGVKKVVDKCIKPDMIPITGYEEFLSKANNENCFHRLKVLKNKAKSLFTDKECEKIEINYTVKDVLNILYGKEGNTPKIEFILQRVLNKIDKLCDDVIKSEGLLNISSIMNTFTLKDLKEKLCIELQKLEFREKYIADDKYNVLLSVVDRKFYSVSSNVKDVLYALEELYFSKYNEYIEQYIKCAYIKIAQRLINEFNIVKFEKQLIIARTILDNCKQVPKNVNYTNPERIFSQESLKESVLNFNSYSELSEADIQEIVNMYPCGNNIRIHVNQALPEVLLLYSNEIYCSDYIEGEVTFKWRHMGVNYLPNSIIWEITIYPIE